jgi:diketogulonate reductase-like aldo/keto reductase
MSTTPVPKTKLSNGVEMPMVAAGCAFGNWTGGSAFQGFLPEQAWRATKLALECGVRHLDTAHAYGTERHVGNVLGRAWMDGDLERGDIFLTTKLAHPSAPPHVNISSQRTWDPRAVPDVGQRVITDFEKSLDDLGVGQVDLLLVHWPGTFSETDAAYARKARAEVWTAFCDIHAKLGARAIGVCNFTETHLKQLKEDLEGKHEAFVMPMVNQIEFNPYCQDPALLAFCQENGIVVEAFAPLASGTFGLLQDPVIAKIAEKHGKSIGQTILRWLTQKGIVVLPKSSKAHRIRENLDLFDVELSTEEMAAIDALSKGGIRRTCPDPATIV